jgi:hypothetical protein
MVLHPAVSFRSAIRESNFFFLHSQLDLQSGFLRFLKSNQQSKSTEILEDVQSL